MTRNRSWAVVIGVILLVALGGWLYSRGSSERSEDGDARASLDSSETSGERPQARRASDRPELAGEPKAAVAGTVTDRDGAPIAGAQVCAWPSIGDLDGLPPGKPRCTTSEHDGHYRVEGLFPVRTSLYAQARGYLPQTWFVQHEGYREDELVLAAGQTREGLDFALRSGGVEIRGVVRDISGGMVEDAFVWAEGAMFEDPGRSFATSDAEGRFTLWMLPGRVSVHAEADGYANGQRETIAPGSSVEVVLTPESVIRGRVAMAGTDEPVSGVVVHARNQAWGSDAEGRAQTDEDGNFRITKLEPGIYTVGARGDELYGEATELVHVALAETKDGVVIELHPAFMVSGAVMVAGTKEPRPCPSGWVRLRSPTDERRGLAEIEADGSVELTSMLPGVYEVEVHCVGMVAAPEYADVEIVDASREGLTWEVREGLAIRGQVVDAAGSPVAGIRVNVTMQIDPEAPREQSTRALCDSTLDDGQFAALGLLPGRYEVGAFSFDRPVDLEPIIVELESGADIDDVRVELGGEGSVSGIVQDTGGRPVVGVGLDATSLSRQVSGTAMSDDAGRFVLEHLPIGEVRVLVRDDYGVLRSPGTSDDDLQGVVATVDPTTPAEIVIVVESQDASIRGQVLDEHGSPVADAFVSHQRMSERAGAAEGASKRSLHWSFQDRPVLTDVDGNFVIERLNADSKYAIGAFRKGGGEAVVEHVSPGQTVELTILATGEISGTVVAPGQAPAPERIRVTLNNLDGLQQSDSLFRSGGRFRMQELPAGTYTLTVDSPAGSARIEGLELAAGQVLTDLVVTLEPRATVRGRLVDLETRAPIPGMSVSVSARGGSFGFPNGTGAHVSDADGRFEIADALTGKIKLVVAPRDFASNSKYSWSILNHNIAADQVVVELGDVELVADQLGEDQRAGDTGYELAQSELGAQPEDYLAKVALVRPGGPAEASGLVVGDVIETVNGHDVRGLNSPRMTLTRVAPGVSFELGLAGGKNLTITAGPAID